MIRYFTNYMYYTASPVLALVLLKSTPEPTKPVKYTRVQGN